MSQAYSGGQVHLVLYHRTKKFDRITQSWIGTKHYKVNAKEIFCQEVSRPNLLTGGFCSIHEKIMRCFFLIPEAEVTLCLSQHNHFISLIWFKCLITVKETAWSRHPIPLPFKLKTYIMMKLARKVFSIFIITPVQLMNTKERINGYE